MGRLFGLDPAPARGCRVLELGCGDGANALSLAQTLPGARVLGVDASPGAVERGTRLSWAATLANVELRCAAFEDLGEDLGEFDYIVAHGVYSWIPPQARGALLDCVKRCLAPEGIALVSYNAYPGSYLRDMARDMLRYHVQGSSDPQARLASAQELMRTIVEIEQPSPFARVLREQMERMLGYSDALLFHDDLAEVSTPFYFHEFIEHASKRGLQFLSEADLFESQMRDVPASAGNLMAGLSEDVVVREQYMDFFKNRMFRQTLLCHETAPVSRTLQEAEIEGLWVSSRARLDGERLDGEGGRASGATHVMSAGAAPVGDPHASTFVTPEGFSMTTSEPLVRAAMSALAAAWPQSVNFATLLTSSREAAGPQASAKLVSTRLCSVLLQAYLARIVMLQGCPPPLTGNAGERPATSPLARAQCETGLSSVSSLLHGSVRLESEVEEGILALLDGTRTLPELAQALDADREPISQALDRFAAVGLLLAT
ncbi:MAG: class I SAM-dependent methyltransferase [Solirubrobacteraceae bacterium]